ncbi:hypothetical protein [Nocardiopsis sp. LOL_012]|uniref:hypothetical protein n=1 Tax=Nocardiopsis sp. LOL_012 TaxID=3345409 RepID=UPI003A8710EE
MKQTRIDRLRTRLTAEAGIDTVKAQTLHSWELSHVERLTTRDGGTVVLKVASEPFTREADHLHCAHRAGIRVPRLLGVVHEASTVGMLQKDLGPGVREPTDADGIAAALALHTASVPGHLEEGGSAWLTCLPQRALDTVGALRERGRWGDTERIADLLRLVSDAAPARAQGAELAPYGWVHSEFHPTSLIVTGEGVSVLDLARTFHGPGLMDLASWHGTVDPADPDLLAGFLDSYVEAGGPAQTLSRRGGLDAARWALGWHRVWIVEWYLSQAARWMDNPETDPLYIRVVGTHLEEATALLDL